MLLNEIRIMRGPNMWSENTPKIIAAKINNNGYDKVAIDKVIKWLQGHTDFSMENSLHDSEPQKAVAIILSELAKYLQPHSEKLYSDTRVMGKQSYFALAGYEEEEAGVKAMHGAFEIVDAILEDRDPISLDSLKAEIAQLYDRNFLGPSTSAIVKSALQRNIPFRKTVGGYITFGQAAYQKKIAASISERTSDISVDIAGDKEITKQILAEALLPVPKGVVVNEEKVLKNSLAKMEYPVVVKPLNANQGKGITGNIQNEEELIAAFKLAKKYSDAVIIEQHITGNDYRFLVIGNKLIAVAHRIPACVTGDGTSTIKELVDQVNADPLRGEGHGNTLTKITIDDNTLKILKSKKLTPDSIPERGSCIYLKDTANLSTGGTAIDVTDEVHPDNILLAERVAAIIGLDICGIDIMAPDVISPIAENGGAILEVNAAPGLRMHVSPSKGKSRNIGDHIVDLLYPEGAKARIPIVAITGTNGKTTTSRLMAHIAKNMGFKVGFTTTDGIYINDSQIVKGDCTGPISTKLILQEPLVNFAVLECARGGILRSGLAFDQCDIGIVTNIAGDHLGLKDIYTIEDLANVKAVVPRSVSPNGYAILNASDELVYKMKDGLRCNIALFSIDNTNEHIKQHCNQGGIAATVDESNSIIIMNGLEIIPISQVEDIPLTVGGKAEFMTENVLPVVLASYLLDFRVTQIKDAIQDFKPSSQQTPGRLNMFDINGIHVILDYAHNTHSLNAFGKYLNTLEGEITGIITGVGDRRDDDIREVGRIAAQTYDKIIIRFDKDTRGRTEKQIADLLISGIKEIDPEMPYRIIPDSETALHTALEDSVKGSYIVISADDGVGILKHLEALSSDSTLV
jgi:cyanophycin synthetase